MKPVNVGLDVSSLLEPNMTGCQRYIKNLLNGFSRIQQSDCLTLYSRFSRLTKKNNFPWHTLAEDYDLNYFQPPVWFHWGVDVFHGLDARMPKLPVHFSTKFIVTIHDVFMDVLSEENKPDNYEKRQNHFKYLSESADHVITPSESTKKDLLKHYSFDENDITIIPEAPDPIFEPANKNEIRDFRRENTLPDSYYLGHGSSTERKNTLRLCRAFYRSKASNGANLVLYGRSFLDFIEANLEPEILESITIFENIDDDDLRILYSGAKAFLFPTLYEGFGLPVLEAMACETPVLTSNTSSLLEISQNSAIHVDPHSTDAILAGIERIRDRETRKTLRKQGTSNVKNYSWTKAARKHFSLYEDVIA